MSIAHHSTHTTSLINLLTQGVSQSEAARALGITPGAVTQLLEHPEVSAALDKYRLDQIAKSSQIDANYDAIELQLLEQMKKVLPLLMRPGEIAQVLTRVNSAKRRGVAHTAAAGPAKVLTLNIPAALQAKFVLNAANQVVEAGNQTLVTMQSANIAKFAEAHHARPTISSTASDVAIKATPAKSDTEDQFGI